MVVDSAIDAYGISLAFYIYNILWDIFAQTGLVYFPMIALIVNAVNASFESSMEDFNTKSSLRKVAMGMFYILMALEFAIYPMVKLEFSDIKYYQRGCAKNTNTGGKVTTEIFGEEAEFIAENMEVQLGSREVRLPVLFYVAIKLSQGIKNWAVDDLPCSTDLRLISDGMINQRIKDEGLKKETKQFIKWCYAPVKAKYLDNWGTGLSDEQNWPGSKKLLLDNGYYDNGEGDGFYAREPILGFGGSTNVLAESKDLPADYGFPTCKEWWMGVGVINTPYVDEYALSTRLYNQLTPWLREHERDIYDILMNKLNHDKSKSYDFMTTKDVVVRGSLFAPIKLNQLNGLSTVDYGDQGHDTLMDSVFRGLGTLGIVGNSINQFSGASMLQLVMPMVKPFIIMIIIISFLPALIIGQYKWKYIGLFHGVVMSIMFWPFFWELARLIDDTMLTALGVDFDEINTQILSQWIAASLHLYGPILFSMSLGWVGLVSADGAFQKMASSAGSSGQQGVANANAGISRTKKGARFVASKGAKK